MRKATAWLRVQQGILAVDQGRLEEARAQLEGARELSMAARSTRSVTLCLAAFAQLAFAAGDPERAALLAGAAEGLRRRPTQPAGGGGRRPEPARRRHPGILTSGRGRHSRDTAWQQDAARTAP